MAEKGVSLARKVTIAAHVQDLLPYNLRNSVTFYFSVGRVERATWARGLSRDHPDDICAPRNPYFFHVPGMGDSIGVMGNKHFDDSTATLGPCISVGVTPTGWSTFTPLLTLIRIWNLWRLSILLTRIEDAVLSENMAFCCRSRVSYLGASKVHLEQTYRRHA